MSKRIALLLSCILALNITACSSEVSSQKDSPVKDITSEQDNTELDSISSSKINLYTTEGDEKNSAPYLCMWEFDVSESFKALSTDWRCDIDALNTYYNVHCWYKSDGNISGYAGFQNLNNDHIAIFSMWSTKDCIPNVEYTKPDALSDTFSNEGSGIKIVTPYNWKVNTWYTMKIQAGSEGGYTYYDQMIKEEGKDWEIIATIRIPQAGLGMNGNVSFLEDWTYNGLDRGDSFRNISAMKKDGNWITTNKVYLSHYNSKLFKSENNTLKCTYSNPNPGIISLRTSGKNIVNTQVFPLWTNF